MRRLAFLAIVPFLALSAAPAHAASSGARAVAMSSRHASVWHQPHRGFLLQDAAQMSSVRVQPRHVALAACGDSALCRTTTMGYYDELWHQWRVLNRNLWALHGSLPRCGNNFERDCAGQDGAVHLGRRWFVAQQRSAFV